MAKACNSGYSALVIALRLARVRRGDTVLIPSLTIAAVLNAVLANRFSLTARRESCWSYRHRVSGEAFSCACLYADKAITSEDGGFVLRGGFEGVSWQQRQPWLQERLPFPPFWRVGNYKMSGLQVALITPAVGKIPQLTSDGGQESNCKTVLLRAAGCVWTHPHACQPLWLGHTRCLVYWQNQRRRGKWYDKHLLKKDMKHVTMSSLYISIQ